MSVVSEIKITKQLKSKYDGENLAGDGILFAFRGCDYRLQWFDLGYGLWVFGANAGRLVEFMDTGRLAVESSVGGEDFYRDMTADERALWAARPEVGSLIERRPVAFIAEPYHKGDFDQF